MLLLLHVGLEKILFVNNVLLKTKHDIKNYIIDVAEVFF